MKRLIEELVRFWSHGALTFDALRKQIFIMRVVIIKTTSDFLVENFQMVTCQTKVDVLMHKSIVSSR